MEERPFREARAWVCRGVRKYAVYRCRRGRSELDAVNEADCVSVYQCAGKRVVSWICKDWCSGAK